VHILPPALFEHCSQSVNPPRRQCSKDRSFQSNWRATEAEVESWGWRSH
jgi:hypothetical protein